MSGRVLNNLTGFQNRTLTGISSEDNIDDIKDKYDFDSSIQSGSLLIGSSSGKYTNNTLTAGANITITNATGQNGKGTITIASSKLGLTAGTNLSKTTGVNGDITLNLDAVIGSMSSINGFTLVTNIASAANQFLLKDNSVGAFPAYSFLTTNANGLIVPNTYAVINTVIQNTILGGTNITKTSAGGNITLNLDGTLTSITKINNYVANVLTVNNSDSQYLIKDANLSANSILSVGSNGKISSTTPTIILSNLTAGTNLTKSSNTINLDATLTSITSVNGYVFNTTTNSTVNQFLLKDTSVGAFSSGDFLTINSSNKVDNISRIDLNNSIVSQVFTSNGLTRTLITNNGYSNISISTTPTINIDDTMTLVNLSGTNGGHAVLKIRAGTSASFSPSVELIQDGTVRTYLQYDKSNNKFYILAPTGVIELLAYGGTGQININNQNVEIKIDNSIKLKVQSTHVDMNTKIAMNSQAINFSSATDANHQILYSGSSAGGTGSMDGVLIRGYGGNVPFFRLQATNPSLNNVLDASYDKVNIYKKMSMNQQPIHLYSAGDTNHLITHSWGDNGSPSSPEMNGVLIKGYGGTNLPFFRIKGMAGGGFNIMNAYIDEVRIYNKLSVIKSNATLQNDTNDIFTVRNTGLTKAIIHSTNGDCKLAFKTGSIEATLVYSTGGTFTISTASNGQFHIFRGTARAYQLYPQGIGQTHFYDCGGAVDTNNGGNFIVQNSLGSLYFQNDRNFVIYRSPPYSGAAFATGSNNNSSRDYKDNIIDLEENESINIIKNINPVSFTYKPAYWDKTDDCNNCGCKVRRGFIWEDVKPILPTACSMIKHNGVDDGSTKMLHKEEIIPDLVKTVQYLMNKVETLESQINNLQNNI